MTTTGLEDTMMHFLLCSKYWAHYERTWCMFRLGRDVRYRMNYLMGMDHRLFQNVSVRDPRNNSYHYMVLWYLCGATHREQSCYLRQHRSPPPPLLQTQTWEDQWFVDPGKVIPNPPNW